MMYGRKMDQESGDSCSLVSGMEMDNENEIVEQSAELDAVSEN